MTSLQLVKRQLGAAATSAVHNDTFKKLASSLYPNFFEIQKIS
jgi:hypothetical protein